MGIITRPDDYKDLYLIVRVNTERSAEEVLNEIAMRLKIKISMRPEDALVGREQVAMVGIKPCGDLTVDARAEIHEKGLDKL